MRRHPIARARQARTMDRATLARLAGASILDVEHWEQGALYPSTLQAVRIARHLRLSLAEVLISAIEHEAAIGRIPPQVTLRQLPSATYRLPHTGPLQLEPAPEAHRFGGHN